MISASTVMRKCDDASHGLTQAQRAFDRQMPEAVHLADWTPVMRPEPTQADINAVIEMLAEQGAYFDSLGQVRKADAMLSQAALCWIDNPRSLPGPLYIAFEKIVQNMARVAKFGV